MDGGRTLGMRLGSLRCSNRGGRGNHGPDPPRVTRRTTYTGRMMTPWGRGPREATLAMVTQQQAHRPMTRSGNSRLVRAAMVTTKRDLRVMLSSKGNRRSIGDAHFGCCHLAVDMLEQNP